MKKTLKRTIQKAILICSTLMMSIPAAALSSGAIAGITVGAVAAATIIGVSVHKHNKHKNGTCTKPNCKKCEKARQAEERKSTASSKTVKHNASRQKPEESMSSQSSQQTTKRSLKKDLKHQKRQRSKHETALHREEREGNSNGPVAQAHRTELEKIEDDIRNLERRIESAL